MNEFKIEKNIPIPTTIGKSLPFNQMNVGDSFFVNEDFMREETLRTYAHRSKSGKFKVNTVEGGFRVWRIS